jgi:hypothetical protein
MSLINRTVADEYFAVTTQVESLYAETQSSLPAKAEGPNMRRLRGVNRPGFDAHPLWREGRAHHAQEVRRINQEQGCPAGR